MIFAQSKRKVSNLNPNSPALCAIMWYSSAFFSSALVGMQPQFRHVPPARSFSTQATFFPSCAARIAPT